MGRNIILALLFVAAMPAVARAQALPTALLSSGPADSRVLPELDATPSTPSHSFASDSASRSIRTSMAQEDERPSLLQHIVLGALGGVVAATATGVMVYDEFYGGIAGAGAILGVLAGVVIWNIRVMP